MDFDLAQRQEEGVWIIDLHGRLAVGDSGAILRQAIATLTDAGGTRVILNFSGVTEIDADGLGTLVSCYARVLRLKGELKMLNLSYVHLNPVVAAKLAAVFEVFAEEQDAVNSFFPDRAIRHYDILDWVQSRETQSRG
jgi:anti-sigma B factor antagonist